MSSARPGSKRAQRLQVIAAKEIALQRGPEDEDDEPQDEWDVWLPEVEQDKRGEAWKQ